MLQCRETAVFCIMTITDFHIHFIISYRLLRSMDFEEGKIVVPGSFGMILLYQASKTPKILNADGALTLYLLTPLEVETGGFHYRAALGYNSHFQTSPSCSLPTAGKGRPLVYRRQSWKSNHLSKGPGFGLCVFCFVLLCFFPY